MSSSGVAPSPPSARRRPVRAHPGTRRGRRPHRTQDVRVLVEHVLDVARPDLVARHVDHVLHAIDDRTTRPRPACRRRLCRTPSSSAGAVSSGRFQYPGVTRGPRVRISPISPSGSRAPSSTPTILESVPRRRHADRERPALRVDRRTRTGGHEVTGRGRLGQAVRIVIDARRPLPALHDRRVHRRPSARHLRERREVARG